MSKILHIILAVGLIGLCSYLLIVESIELPSRYGSTPSVLTPPVTYLIATLPFAFGLSLILYVIDSDKYKKCCRVIIAIGVMLFFIGIVIVAPLLKAV